MSVVTITIIIVAIIAICVVGMYIAQSRERARIEKINKIKALSDRHERFQRLLHELPPQYVSDDLRAMIAQRSIETANQLLGQKKSKRFEGYLQADEEYLSQLQAKKLKLAPVQVKNQEQAQEIRKLLEVLFKFVQQQAKLKQIEPARAKQYSLQIKFAAAKSRADGLVAKAEHATRNGKPRVAIHAYHTAIESFKNIADYPKAADVIAHYKTLIKALEQDADKHNQEVKAKAQDSQEGSGEWDKFLGDDDQWKKKNAYDD